MNDKAVIFDMDGVLVDSCEAHFQAWLRFAEEMGVELTREQFADLFGRTNRDIFRIRWPGLVPPDDVASWDRWKEERYREILREDFPAMDGARELVAALRDAGFRLAIGSSGPPENVRVALDEFGEGTFGASVSAADVTHGKPHPEVFLTAAEKLGVAPAACAVMEDAPAGVEAAVRAGMTPVALTGTADRATLAARGAVQVVDSLRDLSPEALAALIERRQISTDEDRAG
jgi:beta-phosphoglucomutase